MQPLVPFMVLGWVAPGFSLCLRSLRHWARSHNVYSSKLGYFNGITLASMVHYVMTTLRRQHDDAQSVALSELTSSSQQSAAATRGSVGPSPVVVSESAPQPSPASVPPGVLPTPERCANGPLFPDSPETNAPVGHPMMVMMPGMSQPYLLVPMNALNAPSTTASTPPSGTGFTAIPMLLFVRSCPCFQAHRL
jgi:hypothetical protein